MADPTQKDRPFEVTSPLGADKLLFRGLSATEQLGRLFHYELELLSTDEEIGLDKLLGKPLSVLFRLDDAERYFHGHVTAFRQAGKTGQLATYHATLRPWLWFLTRTADCRIFQQKTVPDIVKEVFRDGGFTDIEDALGATYRKWEYCVQYRETDFNFVSRLLEQEGIYYYFKHAKDKHTLVLADSYSAHAKAAGYEKVPYFPPTENVVRDSDFLSDWQLSHEVQPGALRLDDYDFERPKADLAVASRVSRSHPHSDLEIYDYPGEYVQTSDGEAYAQARLQEHSAQYAQVQASGNVRGLGAGHLFELTGFPRKDQNREYLIVSASLEFRNESYETGDNSDELSYHATIGAIDGKQQYRAPRITPKPVVQGPQTAMVVGKKGEEIWTDKYGRVKVQFHWDRYGKSDENSSCWIRVSAPWAGKQWGSIQIPRIGEEVIVEFLEGDPDHPIVTGRVWNADCMPPYGLPDSQTQSGLKSRSTKKGGPDHFNELRFEDKKDEEHIYFHAEKDFERIVENDDKLKVGFDKKDPGDQTIEVYHNRTATLAEGDDKLQVKKGSREVLVDKGDQTHKIAKGNRIVEIHGDDTLTVKTGNQMVKISAGKGSMQAAMSVELKVGGSSVKIEPAKITLKAPQIEIQGDAKIDVKSPMSQVSGDGMLTLKGGMVKIN